MEEISKNSIEKLISEINDTVADLDIDRKKERIKELKELSLDENFWKDSNSAKKVTQEIGLLEGEIESAERLQNESQSMLEIFDSISEEERPILQDDYSRLYEEFSRFQVYKYLSGKYDRHNALLSIHAGQGGTEANDWSEMIYRMYTKYFDSVGYGYSLQQLVPGGETGISSVTLLVEGPFAYGKLKHESGTHRLVRVSPFNSQGLRQTSFTGVEVLPEITDDDESIVIEDKDIEFKAVRSSGAGGQSVNKTSSAVQITHIPSGITVHNSEHKGQAQNRKAAMTILKSRLWRLQEEARQKEMKDLKGEYKIAGWGNQIRNYVLHPYKLVKDLRTGVESNDPDNVLDGQLEQFIEAEIRIR